MAGRPSRSRDVGRVSGRPGGSRHSIRPLARRGWARRDSARRAGGPQGRRSGNPSNRLRDGRGAVASKRGARRPSGPRATRGPPATRFASPGTGDGGSGPGGSGARRAVRRTPRGIAACPAFAQPRPLPASLAGPSLARADAPRGPLHLCTHLAGDRQVIGGRKVLGTSRPPGGVRFKSRMSLRSLGAGVEPERITRNTDVQTPSKEQSRVLQRCKRLLTFISIGERKFTYKYRA